jgi:hypothetical protein
MRDPGATLAAVSAKLMATNDEAQVARFLGLVAAPTPQPAQTTQARRAQQLRVALNMAVHARTRQRS